MSAPPSESDGKYHAWKVDKRTAHLPYDVESWAGALEAIRKTFPGKLLPLPIDTAHAMLQFYRHTYMRHPAPTPAQYELLHALEAELDAAIGEVSGGAAGEGSRGGAFVRLSSRSPKDACVLDRAVFLRELRRHLARSGVDEDVAAATLDAAAGERRVEMEVEVHMGSASASAAPHETGPHSTAAKAEAGGEADDDRVVNARMLAFSEASWRGLRVDSGRRAMAMLLASERAFVDLLEATEAAEIWGMRVVVREWAPALRQDLEFRGFVHAGRLVAVSQYNHYVHMPHIWRHARAIAERIHRCWRDELCACLAEVVDDYVVDFAVLPRATPGQTPSPTAAETDDAGEGAGGGAGAGADGEREGAAAAAAEPADDDVPRVSGDGLCFNDAAYRAADVMVVELNPFDNNTGAGLFDWRKDAELLHGRAEPSFHDTHPEEAALTAGGAGTGGAGSSSRDAAPASASAAAGLPALPLAFRMHAAPVARLGEFVDYCIDEGFLESDRLVRRWPPESPAEAAAGQAGAALEAGGAAVDAERVRGAHGFDEGPVHGEDGSPRAETSTAADAGGRCSVM